MLTRWFTVTVRFRKLDIRRAQLGPFARMLVASGVSR